MKRLLILFVIAVVGWFAVGRHLPQANPNVGLEAAKPAKPVAPAAGADTGTATPAAPAAPEVAKPAAKK